MKPLNVGILGAGPAGLYAAILLKLANPATHIRVIERNPAGATFGFGVVLSDKTLTAFREADPVSFDQITAHQSTWEAIETIHRGVRVRCEGHYYLGIGRKRLLDILQRRAEALGIEVQFLTEVADLTPFDGCDLVIAADGINSVTRRSHADVFQPSYEVGEAKFIWLGIEAVPSAFTFIFHETEHGVFQAHIYPFDATTSTCIVMCRDATWRRAGLDKLDEPSSVQFCKELLFPYLGDVNYLANRSLWSSFTTVKAKNWSHGNVVLLGDAVHTAHWSIGSGTKLAMEDAVALVAALKQHDDIPTALQAYQIERKPVAEKIQRAGQVSERYCENIERAMHLEPLQFAFQLMIRSRRLDYESLKKRDPQFIAALDTWFAEKAGAEGVVVPGTQLAPLLSPVRLRSLLLRNRVAAAVPPGAIAAGQPGVAAAAAAPAAGAAPGLLLAEAGESAGGWKAYVDAVHSSLGCHVALQIGGAAPDGAVPDGRAAGGEWLGPSLANTARRAAAAGFDLLQVQATPHSELGRYLHDEGALPVADRLRVPAQVIAAVRAAWPSERPLSVSLSVGGAAGLSPAEAVKAARAFQASGCDLIHLQAAVAGGEDQSALLALASELIRTDVGVATMVDCRGATSGEVNTLIAGARADCVCWS